MTLEEEIAAEEAKAGIQGGNLSDLEREIQEQEAIAESQFAGQMEGRSVDELHPAVTTADRLVVNTFAQDADEKVKILRRRLGPDFEIRNSGGDIQIRKKGEGYYRKFDPGTFTPQEVGRDVLDVANDVGQAGLTFLGGMGGAAVGGVPGAFLGASLAEGGQDYLKDAIAKHIGSDVEPSASRSAVQGGAAGLATLAFGAGGAGEDLATKGLINRAYTAYTDKLAPKIGEWASGVPEEVINAMKKHFGMVESMDKGGIKKFAKDTAKEAGKKFSQHTMQTGRALQELVTNAQGTVNVLEARAAVEELRETLAEQVKRVPNDANEAALAELDNVINTYFKKNVEVPQNAVEDVGMPARIIKMDIQEMAPFDAWQLAQQLDNFSEAYNVTNPGLAQRFGKSAATVDKRISNSATTSSMNLRGQLDALTDGEFSTLSDDYADAKKLQAEANAVLKSPKSTYRNMSNLMNDPINADTVNEIDALTGSNIAERASIMQAYKAFNKAPWLPVSSRQVTATSRAVPISEATAAAGQALGKAPGRVAGGLLGTTIASPRALKGYMKLQRNYDTLANQMRGLGLPTIPQSLNLGLDALEIPDATWEFLQKQQERMRQ